MQRIAIVTNLYPPFDRGGAEQIARRQAEFLSKENKVVVITSHPEKDYEEKIVNENLKIIYFKVRNIFPYYEIAKHNFFSRLLWRWKDMHNESSAEFIKNILEKENIQKVFLHNLTGLGYQIPKMIKNLGIKQILTLHDVQLIHPSGQLGELRKLSLLEKFYVKKTRVYFSDVDVVISPSKFLANYHLQYGFWKKENMRVLFNPVNDDFYRENSRTIEKPIKLLYVGQLNTAKGLQFLLKEVLRNANFTLEIAGAGILEKYLQEMILKHGHRLKYHGRVTQEQLKQLYDEANFLVLPSLIQENLPTVILEAGARALPAIASRVGGVAELIDEKSGFTFPADNDEVLQNILKEIENLDNDFYRKMQKAAFEKAQEWKAGSYFEEIKILLQ